ncbi:SpoIIE family protein phosphatase [Streptomyces sp. NPDC059851]|uniref:SpoIIE family protein phosphatase n=1 Tax=Streptomyces sp. NPDC059851 TaxID=3346971 RepID=UPI0036502095
MTGDGESPYRGEGPHRGRGRGRADAPALDAALSGTVLRTGASAGALYLWDGDRNLGLALVCGVSEEVVRPWFRISATAPTPVAAAVREDRLVWVGSQEDLAREYPRAAVGLPYRFALAAAPLPGRKGVRGALLLLWPASHPRNAGRREQHHITAAARRIARILDAAGPLPPVPERPRVIPVEPSGPLRGGRAAQAAADWVERLPEGAVALDLEGRITFLDGTAAALLGRSAAQLLGTRPWQSLPWLDTPLVEDRYRTAVISRDPVEFTARHPPDQWLHFQLYPDAGGISARITPTGRPATTPQPGSSPAAPPHPHRTPAGPQTGRIYQLLHLAAALTETVAVRDVVDLVADQVLPAFGADALVLSAAEAGRLKITGYHGYDPATIERLDGLPLDTELTPAGQVLADGVPAFFGDAREIAHAYPGAPRISGKQAWAFLPLMISGRPVGCCILSYERTHTFTADERAVLTSLAGLIAQALDRARLHDAAHDLAHGLQQALLPHSLPAVPGLEVAARYLPSGHGMDIGGDFYDVIRLDTATVAAVIGDVQGHNVAAAALMGQVRTAIRAAAGAPPGEVLARTGRLLADLDTDLLVSCLYVHIDVAHRLAILAAAGHPPPLVHRPGTRPHPVDLDPAPLLGVGIDTPCPVTHLDLTPGTLLALYTDGLVEKPTAAGIDPERATAELATVLAAHGGADLDDLIERLVHGQDPALPQTDDIALLLLRI